MKRTTGKIKISGQSIRGEIFDNDCIIAQDDYINLDHGVGTDHGLTKEFLNEHCPLTVIIFDENKIILKETLSDKQFEISLNQTLDYKFKDKNYKITYLGINLSD